MAGGSGRAERGVPEPDRPGTVGEGPCEPRHEGVHAPRRLSERLPRPLDSQGLRATVKGIADTGFLLAFANRNDMHHAWAVDVASRVTDPPLTCEAVLAETAFHLGSVPVVLQMMDERLVVLSFDVRSHLPHLAALAERFKDRRPDLADLCMIRMSELYPRHVVVTTDREDFRVYRRNKREMIPTLCPPDT